MSEQRSVLLISAAAFHLGWMGSTRRIFHLTKAFNRLGFQVVLLAGRTINPAVQKRVDEIFPGCVLRTNHSGNYPRVVDWSPFLRRAWRGLWKMAGDDVYWSNLSWGWAKRLNIEWIQSRLNRYGLKPAMIWVILGGHLWDAVAADTLSKEFGIPWVFEVEDPPWGAGIGEVRAVIRNRYEELLSSADLIVTMADSYRDVLVKEFGIGGERIYTLYLTYDKDEVPVQTDGGSSRGYFNILYAGSLEPPRSLKPLLLALQRAAMIEPDFALSSRLVLVGKGRGFHEARRFVIKEKLSVQVDFLGIVSGDEALRLLQSSSVSVILQPYEFRFQIPGKLYSCLLCRKPVIGIMPADCEAAILLRRSGLGLVHEGEDIQGLANSLINLWSAWREGRPLIQPVEEYIEQFSFERLPGKLCHVLKKLRVL